MMKTPVYAPAVCRRAGPRVCVCVCVWRGKLAFSRRARKDGARRGAARGRRGENQCFSSISRRECITRARGAGAHTRATPIRALYAAPGERSGGFYVYSTAYSIRYTRAGRARGAPRPCPGRGAGGRQVGVVLVGARGARPSPQSRRGRSRRRRAAARPCALRPGPSATVPLRNSPAVSTRRRRRRRRAPV